MQHKDNLLELYEKENKELKQKNEELTKSINKIKDKQIEIIINIDNKKSIKKTFRSLKYTKIEWCMNKDDVPPQEIFNLHKTYLITAQ